MVRFHHRHRRSSGRRFIWSAVREEVLPADFSQETPGFDHQAVPQSCLGRGESD